MEKQKEWYIAVSNNHFIESPFVDKWFARLKNTDNVAYSRLIVSLLTRFGEKPSGSFTDVITKNPVDLVYDILCYLGDHIESHREITPIRVFETQRECLEYFNVFDNSVDSIMMLKSSPMLNSDMFVGVIDRHSKLYFTTNKGLSRHVTVLQTFKRINDNLWNVKETLQDDSVVQDYDIYVEE